MKKKGAEQLSLKAKLMDLLSRREYSRAEIEQKINLWLSRKEWLSKKNNPDIDDDEAKLNTQNELQKLLDTFEAKGWLSDQRYVESFINQKAHRIGCARIKQELRTKGIHENVVLATIEELEHTEFDRAYDVWERKFKVLPQDDKGYQKQMRFLIYRGFSADVVKKILSGAEKSV